MLGPPLQGHQARGEHSSQAGATTNHLGFQARLVGTFISLFLAEDCSA